MYWKTSLVALIHRYEPPMLDMATFSRVQCLPRWVPSPPCPAAPSLQEYYYGIGLEENPSTMRQCRVNNSV